MSHAITRLNSEGHRFQVTGGTAFEIDVDANTVATTWESIAGFPHLECKGDMAQQTEVASGIRLVHHADVTQVVLAMAGTPCTKVSRGIFRNRPHPDARVGFHVSPSNLLFLQKDTLRILENQLGHRMLGMAENVIPACSEWTQDMARLGFIHQTGTRQRRGAERHRLLAVTRALAEPVPVTVGPAGFSLPDGHVWPDPREPGSAIWVQPPTLRACYPELLARAQDPTRALDMADRATIRQFRIIHQDTKVSRYAGPLHLLYWLHAPESMVEAFSRAFPCDGIIDDIQGRTRSQLGGSVASVPDDRFHPCGATRLCGPCSRASRLLGNSWHHGCASDMLYALLKTFALDPAGLRYQRFRVDPAQHVCGAACPMASTIASI